MLSVPKTLRGRQAVSFIKNAKPNIFLITTRSLNGNVVVYEAEVKNKKITGIKFYWLNLEPAYRSNVPLVENCNLVEKYVFGYSVIEHNPRSMTIVFNKLKTLEVHVVLTTNNSVKCFVYIPKNSKTKIFIDYLYVYCQTKFFVPQVVHVEIHGKRNNRKVVHKIKNT
jgi:hypothetical protein